MEHTYTHTYICMYKCMYLYITKHTEFMYTYLKSLICDNLRWFQFAFQQSSPTAKLLHILFHHKNSLPVFILTLSRLLLESSVSLQKTQGKVSVISLGMGWKNLRVCGIEKGSKPVNLYHSLIRSIQAQAQNTCIAFVVPCHRDGRKLQ